MEHVDVAVVGGGLVGLATAWQLLRGGAGRVMLLEARPQGHLIGGSHGRARTYRSTYRDPVFVELMSAAHQEWEALAAEAGEALLVPTPGCFFGPRDGPWATFAHTAASAGHGVRIHRPEELDPSWSWIRFMPGDGVLIDPTAGVVRAAATLEALTRLATGAGATLCWERPVTELSQVGASWRLDTPTGAVRAERVVVCAGAWSPGLLPSLAGRITPLRQAVAYLSGPELQGLPPWAWFGTGAEEEVEASFIYGLDDAGGGRHKAAVHRIKGTPEPTDQLPSDPDISDLLAFWRWRMVPQPRSVEAESCLYACTDDEDFVLSEVPGMPGVVVGTGLTGHGFKFGPLLGRILAELSTEKRSTVAAFEGHRERFRLS